MVGQIKDVCSAVYSGGTPNKKHPEYYEDAIIPWLNTGEIKFNRIHETEKYISEEGFNNSSAKWVPANAVIIAMYGASAARTAITKIPLTTNQACCNLIVNEQKADYRYVYYWLCSQYKHLTSLANGGAQQNLNAGQIKEYPIEILPLEYQKRTADILSAIDDKIEINNQINRNLSEQAQALFKAWFVDFEPFGREMPSDWTESNLLGIANYTNGLAMQKFRPKDGEAGLPVLKIKELRQGHTDSETEVCSPSIKDDYKVHDGDVIFSWSGSLLVDLWCGGECGLNQHLFKVTSSEYDKWFYYYWTKFHLDKFIALAADMATTMGHIKRGELEKSAVLIPNEEDYKEVGEMIRPLVDLMVRNRVENKQLEELRDTLLPKLMSGELDVSNIEI